MSILIYAPNWVGDHIMAFPFYMTLKKIFTEAELLLVGRKWVGDLVPQGIFGETILFKGKYPDPEQIGQLKKKEISMGISLSPSFRSIFFFLKAGVSIRLGYKTDFRGFLLSRKTKDRKKLLVSPYNQYEHRSLSYIRLLTSFFSEEKNAEEYWSEAVRSQWNFALQQTEKNKIQSIFRQQRLTSRNYWVLCPGSVAPSKTYPISHLIQLIELSTSEGDEEKIVLVGTDIEKAHASDILKVLSKDSKKRMVNLTNKTNLRELFHIVRGSRVLIANDSGIAHLAFLTQTPLVTFLGMGRKEETLSLASKKIVLNQHLPCAPCMKQICPRKDFPMECLITVRPEEVHRAVRKLGNYKTKTIK